MAKIQNAMTSGHVAVQQHSKYRTAHTSRNESMSTMRSFSTQTSLATRTDSKKDSSGKVDKLAAGQSQAEPSESRSSSIHHNARTASNSSEFPGADSSSDG